MFPKSVTRSVLSAVQKPQTFRNVLDGVLKRGYQATKAGPPKYPINAIDIIVFGGGFVFAINILPLWALRQVRKWSEIHNRNE